MGWHGGDLRAIAVKRSKRGRRFEERCRRHISDYPRAAERAAALVPAARIIVLLREPVSRVVSSFNMRWQIEVCGKLTWTRPDCYRGVTSREAVRENAVGPFQRAAALKVWGKCSDGKALRAECLRADFVAKLRNRTRHEMSLLDDCTKKAGSNGEGLGGCLGLRTLSQRKLYKAMEDGSYIYRSIYVEHLQNWLKFYPPNQLLVLPSEALFDDGTRPPAMAAFATFLGLPSTGPTVDDKVLDRLARRDRRIASREWPRVRRKQGAGGHRRAAAPVALPAQPTARQAARAAQAHTRSARRQWAAVAATGARRVWRVVESVSTVVEQ